MSFYEDKLFPVLLDWATRPVYRDRQRLLAQASGRVLELGVGTGANFPFYSHTATEIHGIEPAGGLLSLARDSAQQERETHTHNLEGETDTLSNTQTL